MYLTGIAGVTHYWWRVKADTLHPDHLRGVSWRCCSGYRLALCVQALAMAAPPVQARA